MKDLDDDDINIHQFVDIAKHSQQLETVYFQGFTTMKEMVAHILTQLPLKRLFFRNCTIAEEVAQVAVDTLKKLDHSFCKIELFDHVYVYMPIDEYTWHQRISNELWLLTWSNRFQEDRDQLIEFFVCTASVNTKLDFICHKSHVPVQELHTLYCSGTAKLWYFAIIATIWYNNNNKTHQVIVHLTCFILS